MRRLIGADDSGSPPLGAPQYSDGPAFAAACVGVDNPGRAPRPGRDLAQEERMIFRTLGLSALLALSLAFSAGASAQKVRLATSEGDIVLQLDREKAPQTVDNFLAYVKAGHYGGTVFHRVIPTFMIQGGGMDKDLKEKKTNPPIPLESRNGLKNERGTVAMARTSDPNSATSQFFINVQDNAFLDQPNSRDGNGYAVFGKVVAGMDVVDKIRAVPTGNQGMHQNVPVTPVLIKKATVEK
jgi:peptidyl-prolyl cis-trans isomerase A (cyclophilin A)